MKKFVASAAAAAVLALMSTAFAQDQMWVSTDASGKRMVMSGASSNGAEILKDTARPGNCPAGSYYETDPSQQMIYACEGDTAFRLVAPESGATMSDGQPYPEGTLLVQPNS